MSQHYKGYEAWVGGIYGHIPGLSAGDSMYDDTHYHENRPYVVRNRVVRMNQFDKESRIKRYDVDLCRMNALHKAASNNQPAMVKAVTAELHRYATLLLQKALLACWSKCTDSVKASAKTAAARSNAAISSESSTGPVVAVFAAYLMGDPLFEPDDASCLIASEGVRCAAYTENGRRLQLQHAELLEGHLDQYLNSPDYVVHNVHGVHTLAEEEDSNTPLHTACKKGHLQVVAQLVSFGPALKTGMRNRKGMTALDLIGTEKPACDPRTGTTWPDEDSKITEEYLETLYDNIRALLQPRYFVPLLESLDGMPPTVGPVWSPEVCVYDTPTLSPIFVCVRTNSFCQKTL
jgi:hypothetical protein